MLMWHIILTGLMLLVVVLDATKFIIPNWLVGLMLLLYPVFVLLSPEPIFWLPALAVGLVAFAIGFVMFSLRWMGGGDVKLFAVCALWCGYTPTLIDFFVWMGILGGALALLLVLIRPILPALLGKFTKEALIPKLFTIGEPLPYGLAIAAGFLIVLWSGHIHGLPV